MPPEIGERVATLEAQQQEGERVHGALFKKVDDQGVDIQAICRDVAQIREQLSGYRGFWAGMVFPPRAPRRPWPSSAGWPRRCIGRSGVRPSI
jgi:hypothetical protein